MAVRVWSFVSVACLIAFHPAPILAQTGVIAGVVSRQDSGDPIGQARVRVLLPAGGSVAEVLSNAEGGFRIAGVPAGSYTIRVEAVGFESTDRDGVQVSSGDTVRLTFELPWQAFDLDPVVVTTSLVEEQRLQAPAAVEVVGETSVRERPAVTLADHVTGVAGVDVIRTGLQGNYVTVRGFNNIFSGATLTLSDYRIASVPSLRANVHHMNPTTNSDVERVEVVLGPGSALYGPNAASGVIHSITRSPIDDPGGTVSLSTGLRQQDAESTRVPALDSVVTVTSSNEPVVHAEGRYAHRLSDRLGFKVSGQYFRGEEWQFTDVVEAEQQVLARECQAAGYQVNHAACQNFGQGLNFGDPEDVETLRASVDNVARGRNNEIERYSIDVRADWRPGADMELVFSGGRTTNVNSIDLTGLGAAQVIDWNSNYLQTRVHRGSWFGQVYYNQSDNTDTYLLRSGRPLRDRSYLFVSQLRNQSTVGTRHSLVYGADLLRTVPRTDGTINGQNEADDDITEFGGYVQSRSRLSDRVDLIGAVRLDTHTRLEDPVVSPRAALAVTPVEGQRFRLTYNRAFSTPTTLNLFLDISGGTVPLGGPFRYDVRAQGATETGMRYSRTNGIPDHMNPFGLLVGVPPRQFQPTTTENLWATAVAIVEAQNPEAGALLGSLPVPTDEQVGIDLRVLNLDAAEGENPFRPAPVALSDLEDIERLRPTITNTFEAGYSGMVNDGLLLAANVYHSRIEDFTSALRVNSPNLFLNRADLQAYLESFGVSGPEAAGLAESIGGAGEHGTAQAPGIPLGVVTPVEAGGTDPAIVLTYENLGTVSLWGADVSATVLLGEEWEISGNAAWVSDDQFEADGEIIPLNAPTFKGAASARYRRRGGGLNGQFRVRHVGAFPANSAVYAGDVDRYTVFDLSAGARLPWTPDVTVQLEVQDLFDQGYRTFVGTPTLGRFALLRLRYEF